MDKPLQLTSTDVVRIVRKRLNTRRVGHAGTLDPTATGLLVVCVGEATKAVPYLMAAQKAYAVGGRFGAETVTDDAAGEVIREADWDHVTPEAVSEALAGFVGRRPQVPPRVCALKKDGRRMYERVRAGEDIDAELVARPVDCFELELESCSLPDFRLVMTVGKGFYVRSLVRDVGRLLGSAAHVADLRRTRIGRFAVEDAIAPDAIGSGAAMMTLEAALAHLPTAHAGPTATGRLRNGQRVAPGDDVVFEPTEAANPDPSLVLGTLGQAVAVCELDPEGRLRVRRGFSGGAAVE